jgi:hypothetical protein
MNKLDDFLKELLSSVKSNSYSFDIAKIARLMRMHGYSISSHARLSRELVAYIGRGLTIIDDWKRVWLVKMNVKGSGKERRKFYAVVVGSADILQQARGQEGLRVDV